MGHRRAARYEAPPAQKLPGVRLQISYRASCDICSNIMAALPGKRLLALSRIDLMLTQTVKKPRGDYQCQDHLPLRRHRWCRQSVSDGWSNHALVDAVVVPFGAPPRRQRLRTHHAAASDDDAFEPPLEVRAAAVEHLLQVDCHAGRDLPSGWLTLTPTQLRSERM